LELNWIYTSLLRRVRTFDPSFPFSVDDILHLCNHKIENTEAYIITAGHIHHTCKERNMGESRGI
jgi:hypothetical protein